MTNILALDTASDACSAALMIGDEVFERYELAPREHTERILPMIRALLAEGGIGAGDLSAVAFGAGPGSFTGVRIAASVAQGIALAHDLPVVAISCLELLAAGAARLTACRTVVPVLDARKQQIYSAIFRFTADASNAIRVTPDWMGDPQDLQLPDENEYIICGSGAEVYRAALLSRSGDPARFRLEPKYPRAIDGLAAAAAALAAGETTTPELARPIYLRAAV